MKNGVLNIYFPTLVRDFISLNMYSFFHLLIQKLGYVKK